MALIEGTAAPEALAGTADADSILGYAGNDSLQGGAGNDTIDGGAGDDLLAGGGGWDRVSYASATAAVQVDMGKGVASGGAGNDTLAGFSELAGSAHGDLLQAGATTALVIGGAGDDTIDGSQHAYGGITASYADATAAVHVDLAAGKASGGDGEDVLVNVTGAIGSPFDDTLVGSGAWNVLQGGGGNDFLDGAGGTSRLAGDAGDDTLVASAAAGDTAVYVLGDGGGVLASRLRPGVDTVQADGLGGRDLLVGIDRLEIWGGAGADTIVGSGGDDFIAGRGGNDVLAGGAGADVFSLEPWMGEQGIDRIADFGAGDLLSLYPMGGGPYAVSAGDGSGALRGEVQVGAYDAASGTTRLHFGYDTVAGADLAVDLVGRYAPGSFTVDPPSMGYLVLRYTLPVGSQYDDSAVGSAANDTLRGLDGDDTLQGGGGRDLLAGGAGDDWMEGGSGRDTLAGGAGFDTASYAQATAGVTVDLAAGTADDGSGATDRLSGIEAVVGSQWADRLTGGDPGQDGARSVQWLPYVPPAAFEVFEGLGGNDTIDGGDGLDWASYASSTSGVHVVVRDYAGVGTASDGWGGTDTLLDVEGVTGSAFDDVLEHGSVPVFFRGGAGNDRLVGVSMSGAFYDLDPAGVIVDLQAGTAIDGWGDTDTLEGICIVIGSSHADVIVGTDSLYGIDQIVGGGGADILDGGDGPTDIVSYRADIRGIDADLDQGRVRDGWGDIDMLSGFEFLEASDHADVIRASAEFAYGRAGDDLLILGPTSCMNGGAGSDTLVGSALPAGATTATYQESPFGVIVDLEAGIAQDGWGGTDRLVNINAVQGSKWADRIVGTSRLGIVESVLGLEGSDTLIGGIIDLATQSNANQATFIASVSVDLATGFAQSGGDTDVLVGINVIVGSFQDDRLRGSDAAWTEEFTGHWGNDTIDGAGGFDIADYRWDHGPVVASLATGIAQQGADTWSAGNTDQLLRIEGLRGSAYADSLGGGNAASDALESFQGNAGDDTIDGGSGFDRADYASATTGVSVTLGGTAGAGSAADGLGGTDVLHSIEAVLGSAFADTLAGSDTAGFESFRGGLGGDSIDGGGGRDQVDFQYDWAAVHVDLAAFGAVDGGSGRDTLLGIEDARGTGFADTLAGDGRANVLEGWWGDDRLAGRSGADTFVFDAAGNGVDTIEDFEALDAILVRAQLSGSVSEGAAEGLGQGEVRLVVAGGLTTLSIGTDSVAGADLQVRLVGSFAASGFSIAAGADGSRIRWQPAAQAAGTGGAETLSGSVADDLLDGQGGPDLLQGLAGADTLRGGTGADTLAGGENDDRLEGGNGADRMDGGAGDDVFLVDRADDLVVEGVGGGVDTVLAWVGWTLGSQVEHLALQGLEDLQGAGNDLANLLQGNGGANLLEGGRGDDTLAGGAGDDTLAGGKGVDVLAGGSGDDTYLLQGGADLVLEGWAHGEDTVLSDTSQVLAAFVEHLVLTGTGSVQGTGNAEANVLTGNGGANRLSGLDGNDTLAGGEGADTLRGGDGMDWLSGDGGDDLLVGGEGADDYAFLQSGSGLDTISGFAARGGDRLLLAAGLNGSVIQDAADALAAAVADGADTVLDLGGGQAVRLLGVAVDTLSEMNFIVA